MEIYVSEDNIIYTNLCSDWNLDRPSQLIHSDMVGLTWCGRPIDPDEIFKYLLDYINGLHYQNSTT